jgi:PII-like signaling protein
LQKYLLIAFGGALGSMARYWVGYRGILGYGAHRRMHKDKALHLSHDCSIMLSAVDTEAKMRSFLPLVDQMVEEGLVILSIQHIHQKGVQSQA